jgi:hypothetical protein
MLEFLPIPVRQVFCQYVSREHVEICFGTISAIIKRSVGFEIPIHKIVQLVHFLGNTLRVNPSF